MLVFSESVDSSSSSKKLAMTVSVSNPTPQQAKKTKPAKRKQLHSVSGITSTKVIY